MISNALLPPLYLGGSNKILAPAGACEAPGVFGVQCPQGEPPSYRMTPSGCPPLPPARMFRCHWNGADQTPTLEHPVRHHRVHVH